MNVVTLGCAKNIFDSEVMMAQLKANDYEVKHEEQDSDAAIVVINTCGFIDNAKEESINTILQYSDAKKEGLVDKNGMQNVDMGEVEVAGKEAKGAFVINGQAAPYYFEFDKENNQWKFETNEENNGYKI